MIGCNFYYCCFLLAVIFNGCNNVNNSNSIYDAPADSLLYSYKTIKQRAADCGSKPDSSCTVAIVKYPEFIKQPVLNDSLAQVIVNIVKGEKRDNGSVKIAVADFIKGYEADKKKFPASMPYSLNISASVVKNSRGLTVINIDDYNYTGGAHGLSYDTFLNWDIRLKKKITLDQLSIKDYWGQLNKIAEPIFRLQEKLSDTTSLATNYFFQENKFALNNNFSLTPKGLLFAYNEYEIKPYAEGITRLLIPYSSIKQLLKPNTVLTQFTN